MRGRAVVGMPSSGTAAGTVGSAFSILVRTIGGVPSHNHSVNPPSTTSTSGGRHSHSVNPPSTASTSTGSHNHSVDPQIPPRLQPVATTDFYTANQTNSASRAILRGIVALHSEPQTVDNGLKTLVRYSQSGPAPTV